MIFKTSYVASGNGTYNRSRLNNNNKNGFKAFVQFKFTKFYKFGQFIHLPAYPVNLKQNNPSLVSNVPYLRTLLIMNRKYLGGATTVA